YPSPQDDRRASVFGKGGLGVVYPVRASFSGGCAGNASWILPGPASRARKPPRGTRTIAGDDPAAGEGARLGFAGTVPAVLRGWQAQQGKEPVSGQARRVREVRGADPTRAWSRA